MSWLLGLLFLAGCVSIPIGDDVLKISTEGIEFVEEVDSSLEDIEEEMGEQEVVGQEEKDEEQEADPENEEIDSTASEEDTEEVKTCEEDYSVFLEELPEDFPMPECAVIGNILLDNSRFDGSYHVKGDWEDTFNFYKEYMGENIESRNQNPTELDGQLEGIINGGNMYINISQSENIVEVRVHYRFPN